MLLVQKVDALLSGLTRKDVEHLSEPQRRKLAFLLRKIADLADPPAKPELPKSGVLSDLRRGHRSE
jgi:hypothetical protein